MTQDYVSPRQLHDGTVILDLKGEITLGKGQQDLCNALLDARGMADHVVLNLTEATRIDSSAVGTIMNEGFKAFGKEGFALYGANKNIREIWDHTKLYTVLPITETEGQALASLPGRPQQVRETMRAEAVTAP